MVGRIQWNHNEPITGSYLPSFVPLTNLCEDITITVKRKEEALSGATLRMIRREQGAWNRRRTGGTGEPSLHRSRDGFLTRDQVKRPFDRAVKAAGVPSIRLHDLRHSFASQLVMKGVPLVAVREYLGHSDIKMTLRYAHLAPAIQQDWIARLDAPMAEDSGHKMGTPGV